MGVYKAEQIRTVHLEITSRCNASCPMCLRNICGGKVNPQLPLTELKLEDIKSIFPPIFVKQLERIYYCGNYGDPVVAQDTLASLRYFKEQKPSLGLSLFSNASARTTDWWQEIAKLTSDVHFAIDGLSDTNVIYRRGTHFDIIMRNAEAFIKAGGRAIWDFIVFRHNEHQVEEARELAKTMGFHKFNIKKTGRFFSNTKSEVKPRQEVLGPDGDLEYYLEIPLDHRYRNGSLEKEELLIAKYGHLDSYLDKTKIDCKVSAEKSVYVSSEGLVFPCCWTANQLYPWYQQPGSSRIWKLIEEMGGKDAISAHHHPLTDLINGDFFKKIVQSWDLPSTSLGKLKPCAKTCGKEFDPFTDQFR